MRRSNYQNRASVWVAAFIALSPFALGSEANGQSVQHPEFNYMDDHAGPHIFDPSLYPEAIMPVGFAGPLFPNQPIACEPQQPTVCQDECCKSRTGGGLLSQLFGGGEAGGLFNGCLFCSGNGCGVCMNRLITLPEAIGLMRPYEGGGLSSMRWYDASVEATFLSHSQGGSDGVITTEGMNGIPVLSSQDQATGDSLKSGLRLSAAVVFGAGANVEVTYMGGNEWDQTVVVQGNPAGSPTLFSVISNFGTDPNGGFDDTDQSVSQGLRGQSKFHSGELNYRRRQLGRYGRFQTSWLLGLRYIRFDSQLNYSAQGTSNNTFNASLPRFFSSNDKVKNNLFGPQAGVDIWWNLRPGVKLGVGVKGAWMQNDSKRQTILTGNSLSQFATPGSLIMEETRRKGTVMGELEATIVYRLNQAWTAKAAYHLLAADDVVFGNLDVPSARDFISGSAIREPDFLRDSLVVQGVTFGAEYTW